MPHWHHHYFQKSRSQVDMQPLQAKLESQDKWKKTSTLISMIIWICPPVTKDKAVPVTYKAMA